jgi:hypothetical protein
MAAMTANFTAGGVLLASALTDALNVHKPLYIQKTADESVISTTVLHDDAELVLTLEANVTYELQCHILVDSNTTADFNSSFSGPAGYTSVWMTDGLATSVAGQEGIISRQSRVQGDSWPTGGSGASTYGVHRPCGYVTTAGTAGAFRFRWAQNTSTAVNTFVRAGSWMMLRRVV